METLYWKSELRLKKKNLVQKWNRESYEAYYEKVDLWPSTKKIFFRGLTEKEKVQILIERAIQINHEKGAKHREELRVVLFMQRIEELSVGFMGHKIRNFVRW